MNFFVNLINKLKKNEYNIRRDNSSVGEGKVCFVFDIFYIFFDFDVKGNKNLFNRILVECYMMDGCIYYYS